LPRVPRDIPQQQAIRALVRLGGVEVPARGKGSHRSVLMPNGFNAVLPYGKLKTGLLADQLKGSEITVEAFIEAL
jgi:predicted RNA binding protein YcfA (HicA-like mRNA interferase family)